VRKPDGDGSTPAPRLSLVYERREEARAAVAAAQPVGSVVLHGVPRSCACALLLLLPVLVSVCLLLLLLVRLRARCVWPSQSLPVRQVLLPQPVGCASSGTDGRDSEGSGGGVETGRVAKRRKLIPPPDVTNL